VLEEWREGEKERWSVGLLEKMRNEMGEKNKSRKL